MAANTISTDSELERGYTEEGGASVPATAAWLDRSSSPDYEHRSPEIEERYITYVESHRGPRNNAGS